MSLFAPTVTNPFKLVIRRLFDEVWNAADFSGLAEMVGERVEYHFRGETIVQAPDDLVRIVARWRRAFPDLRFDLEGILAERNLVAVRLVYRGTHAGAWKGIAATGREVEVHEMMFFRFEDDRIAEVWEVGDEDELRRQLAGQEGLA